MTIPTTVLFYVFIPGCLGVSVVSFLGFARPDGSPRVPSFLDSGRAAGLRYVVVSGDKQEKRFLIESVGGGLAVLDYNNDGWMDLYVAGGGTIETSRAGDGGKYPGALYRNNRDGTFTDVTRSSGV